MPSHPGRTVVAAAIVVVGASACSSAHAHSSSVSAAPLAATPSDSGSTSTCHPTLPAGEHDLTMTVGTRARVLIVHVPRTPTLAHGLPLVVDMHGSGSTAAAQAVLSGMDASADTDGFVVVYPQAIIPAGAGFDWNIPGVPLLGGAPVPAGAADDVAFVKTVVARMHALACIDLTRVYATGFSGGARMSSQLACDASTTFAAVAPVSGLRLPSPCPASRAVPVIAFHGTADPIDPYDGHGQAYWTYSVPVAAQRWSAQDGCTTSRSSQPAAGVALVTDSGCRDGAAVELYTLAGDGHEWPGGPKVAASVTRVLGLQSRAVDADEVMWTFFTAHPMT